MSFGPSVISSNPTKCLIGSDPTPTPYFLRPAEPVRVRCFTPLAIKNMRGDQDTYASVPAVEIGNTTVRIG